MLRRERVGAVRLPAFLCGEVIRFFGVVVFVFSETPCQPALFDDEGVQVDAVFLGRLAELLAGHLMCGCK